MVHVVDEVVTQEVVQALSGGGVWPVDRAVVVQGSHRQVVDVDPHSASPVGAVVLGVVALVGG